MAYSTGGLHAALNGVKDVGTHLSLHTGDPGTSGAAEDAGVTRQAAGWGTPAAGELDSTEAAFTIPAAAEARTYTHFGVYTAATGGTFLCGGALDEAEVFSANGGVYNFTATLVAASAAA